ncbi:MAG: FCD domain-containing protein [Nocardioidaceae bacterium]
MGQLEDAALRPVRGQHAFESCVERLATSIRLGIFPTGSRLPPERELAERLGVSRATLREAIAGLRVAGMVRTVRGRGGGTVVAYEPEAPSQGRAKRLIGREAELLDSLVFRRVVEPGACYLAAQQGVSEKERQLLTSALAAVAGAPNAATHRQADSRLHLAIASVTRSPAIVTAVTEVQGALDEMLRAIPVLPVNIEHSSRQHETIVRGILAGDPTHARRAMERHCDDTAALLRGLLG